MRKKENAGKHMFRNLSFGRKLMLLLVIAMLPVCVLFLVFGIRISDMTAYQNRYAMGQNFEQVCQSLENRMEGMEEIAVFLLSNGEIQDGLKKGSADAASSLERFNEIEAARRIFLDSKAVDEIIFYLDSSFPMAGRSIGNKYRDMELVSSEAWYGRLLDGQTQSCWGVLSTDGTISMDQYISYLHVISDADDFTAVNGILCISVQKEELEALMIPVLDGQEFWIQSGEAVLVCNSEEMPEPIWPEEDTAKRNGETCYCLVRQLGNSGLELVSVIPEKTLSRQTSRSVGALLLLLAILVIIICWIYLILGKMLSGRITHLAEICRQSEAGVIVKAEEDDSRDEIGDLYRAYNRMTEQIDGLMKEQYRIGEEVKDAQLKALQAQINPHFLYNTLEMIGWMVSREDEKSVKAIIRSLTRYYKSVLNKGQDQIDIMDELRMGEAYMDIQSCRFKGKIFFQCEIGEDLGQLLVPKLILQPLLENAINHGIGKKKSGRGTIWLKAYRQEGKIIMEVTDDGVGFQYAPEAGGGVGSRYGQGVGGGALPASESGSRYGLENIRQRIRLFFHDRADLVIESTPGIGTSVYIWILTETADEKGEGLQ